MADTLKQLRDKAAAAEREAQKVYSSIAFSGSYDEPSLVEKYKRAKASGKVDPALEAQYRKAQEEYARLRKIADQAKKDVKNAEKTASQEKAQTQLQAKTKTAYDIATAKLNDAADSITFYGGQDAYTAAYNAAKTARDEYVKAGGKAPELTPLPTSDVAKQTIDKGQEGQGAGANGITVTPNPSTKELMDKLSAPENKDIYIQYQKALAKNFGYKGNTVGKPDASFLGALQGALQSRSGLPDAWKGTDFQSFLFSPTVSLTPTGTGTGPDKTVIKNYTVQFDKTQAEKVINGVFQSQLGRDMTTDEFNTIFKLLDTAQKKNPTKYQVVTDSSGYITKDSKQTGGLDPEQYVIDLMKSGAVSGGKTLLPDLKQEYATVKVQAPELTKLAANKRLYESALGQAGPDLAAKQKVKESTAYGRGLKELNTQIADYVINAGGTNTPDEIAKFAEDLYNRGYDLSSEVGLSELQNFINYTPGEGGKYSGKAGTVIADLAATAMANGLDLNKTFGNKLQGWLTDINKGEPIDNIKQQIREVAKIGMPDNVKKLIDNGMDLETIYSPYKSTMASVLELSPDAIQLSDPTLRAAITGQGEVPLYDFERALRKDDRWQYTNQARGEVSNATQRILQDFGFMG